MERYLITQSLLSSWGYMFSCWEDGQDQAKEDFIHALNREKEPPTEAMIDGINFEQAVYATAAGRPTDQYLKWEGGIQKIASIIRGAPTQIRVRRDIEVDRENFLVFGVLDALKAGIIYDVKYKVKSFGSLDLAGSYLDSPQHPAYLYMVPEAREFQYLVSDGTDLYTEVYTRADTRFIGDIIAEFKASVETMGLWPLYKEKWLSL